jgi:hypothetical protein
MRRLDRFERVDVSERELASTADEPLYLPKQSTLNILTKGYTSKDTIVVIVGLVICVCWLIVNP